MTCNRSSMKPMASCNDTFSTNDNDSSVCVPRAEETMKDDENLHDEDEPRFKNDNVLATVISQL